ncbi:MAG: Replication initiator protein pSAM2 [Solirubrobacteraceae bacterium]|nr:Replication initiator protein pSAM2 [Solirubrobacteraceae bacterium]
MTAAIATGEPPERASGPHPAPATASDPNGLVLRVLAAMSTGERVLMRLQDGSEHVGRIVPRTVDGLVLDTGKVVAMAELRTIMTAPPELPKRDKRDRRLAACAHTFGYGSHCLTKSRCWSTTFTALRQAREDHARATARQRQPGAAPAR